MNKLSKGLKSLLFEIAGEQYRDLLIIALAWKSVVGELLSERYKVVKFEKKTLFIEAVNHLWLQDFVLYKPMYLEKLRNETKLEIDNIIAMVKNR